MNDSIIVCENRWYGESMKVYTKMEVNRVMKSFFSFMLVLTVLCQGVQAVLPEPWQGLDVGNVGSAGSSYYSDGTFTVSGSGADIWDRADEFQYVCQPYTGDFQIEGTVVSQTVTDGWAKAGLMIRETLADDSCHVMIVITPSNGSSMQHRPEEGGVSYHITPGNGMIVPCHLKLIRVGDEFSGYSSNDGENWVLISSVTVSMAAEVYAGLCVTAHNDGQISTAEYVNVSIVNDSNPPEPDPAGWSVMPYASSSNSVEMTAIAGTDISGPVEYYFEETSGNSGGNSSGWISEPVYKDLGLQAMETYTYVVRMRDTMGNVGNDSIPVSVTTGPIPDSDDDNDIDLADYAFFSSNWQKTDSSKVSWGGGSDFDLNGVVDIPDLEILCSAWLGTGDLGHFYDWAVTPPMGWNSWDCFGCSVTESEVKANADYMAAHLKQYGWEYIVVDIQWYEPKSDLNSADPYSYPSVLDTNIDEYGRVWPVANKHPSSVDGNGFMPLADYVHSLGLKFGVHMMRGIPKAAYESYTPVKGTIYSARDIADISSTCSWNPDMYGVDMSKPGAQEYYNSVIDQAAGWGVDYIKIDDLSRPYHQDEIEAIRKAIDQCGRAIVFSTSPGATPLTSGEHVSQNANLWRISDDFWDSWGYLDDQFQRLYDWSVWRGNGHYPDADMLPLGNVRARSNGWTNFTETEQKTMMTLWAIARSPLMMGGHMPNNDAYTQSLLTNAEVLEVNQHSENNRAIVNSSYPIWAADVPECDDIYLAVFNRTSTGPTNVQVILSHLGVKRCMVRDLWLHTDLGEYSETFSPDIEAHGAGLYRITILEKTPVTEPVKDLYLINPDFDTQVIGDGGWTGAGDISGWNDDTGGWAHAQNLSSSAIVPESQNGDNTCGLNQGAWIGQNLSYTDGSSVVIEPEKVYQVSLWVGRRLGTEGTAAGILTIYLEDTITREILDEYVYDLEIQSQGEWVSKEFELTTGTAPGGTGNPLRLGMKNTGTRGGEFWYGQVVIDDIDFSETE